MRGCATPCPRAAARAPAIAATPSRAPAPSTRRSFPAQRTSPYGSIIRRSGYAPVPNSHARRSPRTHCPRAFSSRSCLSHSRRFPSCACANRPCSRSRRLSSCHRVSARPCLCRSPRSCIRTRESAPSCRYPYSRSTGHSHSCSCGTHKQAARAQGRSSVAPPAGGAFVSWTLVYAARWRGMENHPLRGWRPSSAMRLAARPSGMVIVQVAGPEGEVIAMAQKANSLEHTKWPCKYHIVFTPKCRRKAIYDQYRGDLGGSSGGSANGRASRSWRGT